MLEHLAESINMVVQNSPTMSNFDIVIGTSKLCRKTTNYVFYGWERLQGYSKLNCIQERHTL